MPHLERLHRATKTAANYFQLKKICFSLEKSTLIKVNGLEEYIYIYIFLCVCVCVSKGYFELLCRSQQPVISVLTEVDFNIRQRLLLYHSYNGVNLSIQIEPITVPDLFMRCNIKKIDLMVTTIPLTSCIKGSLSQPS